MQAPHTTECTHDAPYHDHSAACNRKMVKGGVLCVRCSTEQTYGPCPRTVTPAPRMRNTTAR